MTATLVASYTVSPGTSNLNTLTTASFTPAVGEILVVKAFGEWSTQPTAGTPTGAGLTYTLRASDVPASQCSVWMWTAIVASASSMTVAVPWSGNAGYHTIVVERWSGGALAGTPATNSTKHSTSTGAPSATLTTTAANSIITWICADRNSNTGTKTYRSSASEIAASQSDNPAYCWYEAYQLAASAGSQTIGMTSPASQDWTMLGIEILASAVTLTATGIASAGAFGAHTVTPGAVTLTDPGRDFSGSFGAHVLTPGVVTLTATGIPSAEAFGSSQITAGIQPVGIPSQEAFGLATLTPGPVTLTVPAGIVSAQAFGAAVVTGPTTNAVGIPSAEAFGLAVLTPGPVTIDLGINGGIASEEAFGVSTIRQISVSLGILLRPPPSVTYELVCVARIPQPTGPPLLFEVDPIDWTGLSYSQELSRPSYLNAGVSISSLTEPILQRLRKLHEMASELWLYRNGKLVFAGPWLGWQVQGETLTLNATGLLGYLRMMIIQQDMVFDDIDQFQIVTGLIDQWQNLDYGNFGIDTSGIADSGIVRKMTYLAKELNPVGQRIEELGARENGFDVAVDPASRKLQLSFPWRGVDRSFGQDAVIFDARNVTSPNIICSAAPGDVASEGYGVGTSEGETIFSTQPNLDLRVHYGRSAITQTFDGVGVQATLDDHVLGLVNSRSQALLIPGPDIRVTPDSDVSTYDVGDIVSYQLHAQLTVTGAFRLRKRQVTVSKVGQERVAVAFV